MCRSRSWNEKEIFFQFSHLCTSLLFLRSRWRFRYCFVSLCLLSCFLFENWRSQSSEFRNFSPSVLRLRGSIGSQICSRSVELAVKSMFCTSPWDCMEESSINFDFFLKRIFSRSWFRAGVFFWRRIFWDFVYRHCLEEFKKGCFSEGYRNQFKNSGLNQN